MGPIGDGVRLFDGPEERGLLETDRRNVLARELLQDDHMVLTTLGPVNDGKKDFEKILSL